MTDPSYPMNDLRSNSDRHDSPAVLTKIVEMARDDDIAMMNLLRARLLALLKSVERPLNVQLTGTPPQHCMTTFRRTHT